MKSINSTSLVALGALAAICLIGCARFKSTVTERNLPGGGTERVTKVSAGTLLDSKNELTKLNSGQSDKSQKVSIGSLNQESSGSNVVSFAESVVGAAVRAAVKP